MAARATSTKAKAAPVEEPEEDEFEDIEEDEDGDLEELEEMEEDEPEAAEKPKRKPPVRPAIEFGSAWLAAHITEKTGEKFDARGIRMLLRKLARDEKFQRVIGEDRTRYEFTGPNDEVVKLVVAMVKSGEAKAMKQAGLEKVKEQAAAKRAAAKKAKEEAAAAEDEDGEEMEEVEEEAPKPTRRRASAPAKATPAKATPAKAATATRRRAAASS